MSSSVQLTDQWITDWISETTAHTPRIRSPIEPQPAEPVPEPDVEVPTLAVDPSNPYQNKHQIRMVLALDTAGYWGLAMSLCTRAKEEFETPGTSPSSYWRILVDDYQDETFHLYTLLLSIPRPVLRSLIRNTFTYDIIHDAEVKTFAATYMQPDSVPGVYANILARKSVSFAGPAAAADDGKWLSTDEIRDLLKALQLYFETGPEADALALRIDSFMPTKLPGQASKRRFDTTIRVQEEVAEWCNVISRQYLGSSILSSNKKFLRCPTEVGWSSDIDRRLKHHARSTNTTSLFGLVQAWLCCVMPQSFPSVHQFIIFRVWAQDKELAQVAEFGASLLLSSYTTDGGLNYALAGNMMDPVNFVGTSRDETAWEVHADNMFLRSHVRMEIQNDLDTYNDGHETLLTLPKLSVLEQENKSLESRLKGAEWILLGNRLTNQEHLNEKLELEEIRITQISQPVVLASPILERFRGKLVEGIVKYRSDCEAQDAVFRDYHRSGEATHPPLSADATATYRAISERISARVEAKIRSFRERTRRLRDAEAAELRELENDPAHAAMFRSFEGLDSFSTR